ncbi:hypothetical protein FB451DRAFT_1166186 [Mycena latifolia]|nr:hypothetical protein FB451DRAFT_1166186 [Mycena latifolia]
MALNLDRSTFGINSLPLWARGSSDRVIADWSGIRGPGQEVFDSRGPKRIVFLGTALWSEADDEIIQEKMHELRRWVERTARDRGLLHSFIYVNYASDARHVMGGVGTENLCKMWRVKDLCDPENRFGASYLVLL